jgi:hypothetical protein
MELTDEDVINASTKFLIDRMTHPNMLIQELERMIIKGQFKDVVKNYYRYLLMLRMDVDIIIQSNPTFYTNVTVDKIVNDVNETYFLPFIESNKSLLGPHFSDTLQSSVAKSIKQDIIKRRLPPPDWVIQFFPTSIAVPISEQCNRRWTEIRSESIFPYMQ